jgi:ribosomal protein S18 acetylase RimI-like enzyme
MIESFSTPGQFSKKQARQEIEEGIAEYLATPRSKKGIHPELADAFEIERAEQPFSRKQIEEEIQGFIGRNLKNLLPILLTEQNHAELIKQFGLTNKEIGLLGANYYIREQDGKPTIFKADKYYPEGRKLSEYEISASDLLALAYAKENIRIDSKLETGQAGGHISHRYFWKPGNRYLCTNDFGMRIWNEEEQRMDEGNVTDITPFIETVRQNIERIRENLETVFYSDFKKIKAELYEAAKQAAGVEYLDHEQRQAVDRQAQEEAIQNLWRCLSENEKDKDLIFRAVQTRKVVYHLHFHFEEIARKYGFITDDPIRDYEQFEKRAARLNRLLREPSEEERAGVSFDFVYSDFYNKPVIVAGNFDRSMLISEAYSGVKEILTRRAIENDEAAQEVFYRFRFKKGQNSPYFYYDYDLYDLIKAVGVERVQQVLDLDKRDISKQMIGFKILRAMRYDFSKFEPDQIRKQLHQAYILQCSGLWRYLEERSKNQIEQARVRLGVKAEGKHWLELIGAREARKLFYEGKRMYWLAKKVWMYNPNRAEGARFYLDDSYVNWESYDLTKADVSEEKLNEYLEKQRNLIVALLGQGQADRYRYGEQPEQGKSATLGLIIQALERGNDIRGVALAHDKQRYLEGVISGKVKNDLEFAIEDWPDEWRQAVSPEEISIYYENANDYVLLDPNGLTKYAAWRASAEGKEWAYIFNETPKRKEDLDFRICLASQTEEVRGWYKDAAEYVGGSVMQNYLLRFNATRGADGRIANWHDVLFWVPNIRKLEAGDVRSILSSIETMDDNQEFVNLLPRYSKERDPLQKSGPIQSLRELKKRILAIESNIDLSQFPPELLEITSAPGFNLAAFESMRRRADFQDLFEGKLDREQPFKPRSRIFVGRDLTEALQEGLGSQRQKIRGTAKDPKGLFHALNQLVKGREIGGRPMTVLDLLNSVPVDLEEEIIQLLLEQQVDVGPIVEAQIHAKSDPEGWVCGNYTDCCMPFGDPKNDDYMFNPSTQYFTIKYNGRIIAQSVVVDARDRETGENVVILDNIEVAKNYKHLAPLLSKVYQTFWTEYTSSPVKVGTGCSDLIPPGGKLEVNRYEPKTPLFYSDARGPQIYDLPKLRGVESIDKIISFANLTERDADLIAKMEAEAYPDSMVQGKKYIADILRRQRELEVPGAASSFLVRQGREVAGYLLVLPEESKVNSGELVAHVYDMVVLPKFRGSPIVRKIMERVLDIASAYGVPIEAEARASTSYALLMNAHIQKWFKSKGFSLTKNEKLPEYLGGEDFYFVRFENLQNAAATV